MELFSESKPYAKKMDRSESDFGLAKFDFMKTTVQPVRYLKPEIILHLDHFEFDF